MPVAVLIESCGPDCPGRGGGSRCQWPQTKSKGDIYEVDKIGTDGLNMRLGGRDGVNNRLGLGDNDSLKCVRVETETVMLYKTAEVQYH